MRLYLSRIEGPPPKRNAPGSNPGRDATKNAENLRSTMMEEVFGCTTPLSAATQRDSFNALVEETLGDDCNYDTVMNIHEKLNELMKKAAGTEN